MVLGRLGDWGGRGALVILIPSGPPCPMCTENGRSNSRPEGSGAPSPVPSAGIPTCESAITRSFPADPTRVESLLEEQGQATTGMRLPRLSSPGYAGEPLLSTEPVHLGRAGYPSPGRTTTTNPRRQTVVRGPTRLHEAPVQSAKRIRTPGFLTGGPQRKENGLRGGGRPCGMRGDGGLTPHPPPTPYRRAASETRQPEPGIFGCLSTWPIGGDAPMNASLFRIFISQCLSAFCKAAFPVYPFLQG